MSVISEAGEGVREASEEVMRIPAGVMHLLRQSYDSREKTLDWFLAFAVAGCIGWIVWKQGGANWFGKKDVVPNQNTATIAPADDPGVALLVYNQPRTRKIAYRVGPSSTAIPSSPSYQPRFCPGN